MLLLEAQMDGSLMGTKSHGWMDQTVRVANKFPFGRRPSVFKSSGYVRFLENQEYVVTDLVDHKRRRTIARHVRLLLSCLFAVD